MDYESILRDIKPTEVEQNEINEMSDRLVDFLKSTCLSEGIDAKITVVGSVAKRTALKGKSDIDIFMAFPLTVSEDYLKETGLYLAHKCNDAFKGDAAHHFASHPYVTSDIEGFEVDFVPCYSIEDGSQLKSAVDRTILHTRYVKSNLSNPDEVLLLKRFMDMTGTYGSEFKVGGFAGYLCELLIIEYRSFEETLKQATQWKFGHSIDLENYGTASQFSDPLVVIDPTDKNRNVAAALTLTRFCEFIQSARNYLASERKRDYFYPLNRSIDRNELLREFEKRGSDFITIKFKMPDMPLDTLYPQLRMTARALAQKLDGCEFNVFHHDIWSDEESVCVFLIELASSTLNSVEFNRGPKVFLHQACENFTSKYGRENCHVQGEFLIHTQEREFSSAVDFVRDLFTEENIGKIKVGKNLRKNILNTYELVGIDNICDDDYYEFLDDFIRPGQHIVR
jgi:tRNA nucleotidyltransferase (CCA-adding enzyme)